MSRARSARGASPAARPSGRGAAPGRPGVFVQAPKSDVYVAMLAIALGAMLVGCLLLILLLQKYDFKTKVSALPNRPAAFALAVTTGNSAFSGTAHLS